MHTYQDPSIVRVMLALSMTMHAGSQMIESTQSDAICLYETLLKMNMDGFL
jgi:hypothetical protein